MHPDQLPPALQAVIARVVKAERRRADRQAENARKEVYAALGEVLVKSLPGVFLKAAEHAPAGGVKVQGKEYTGGQFIPADVMQRATAEERAAVSGEGKRDETRPAEPKPDRNGEREQRARARAERQRARDLFRNGGDTEVINLAGDGIDLPDKRKTFDPERYQRPGAVAEDLSRFDAVVGEVADRLAGTPDADMRKVTAAADRMRAKLDRAGGRVEAAGDAYRTAVSAREQLAAAEPDQPTEEMYAEANPDDPEPPPPADPDADTDAYDSALESWESRRDKWLAKAEKEYEKTQAKWEAAVDKADDKVDAAADKMATAIEVYEELYSEVGGDLADVVSDAVNAKLKAIDAEERRDEAEDEADAESDEQDDEEPEDEVEDEPEEEDDEPDRLTREAKSLGLSLQLADLKEGVRRGVAADVWAYRDLLAACEDEWNTERFTKADRSHLVRKVIRNKLGRRQVVWVKPQDAAKAERGGAVGEDGQPVKDEPKPLTREQVAESRTIIAQAVADPNKLNPEQLKDLARHVDAITKEEARGLLKTLGAKLSGDQKAVAERLVAAVRAGREQGKGVGDALRAAGNKTTGQYGAWGAAAGGGAKPVSRDEFPKRGAGPGESSTGERHKESHSQDDPAAKNASYGDMTDEQIGQRIDSLLNKGGEIEKAREAAKSAADSAEWSLHIHGRVDGKYGLYDNPGGGRSKESNLVSLHETEQEAEEAYREQFRKKVQPHKERVSALEKESRDLIAEEERRKDKPAEAQPKKPSVEIPEAVSRQVKDALAVLKDHADNLERGRQADKKFRGEGRYEREAHDKGAKRLAAAKETLDEFRKHASGNGVDAEQVITSHGGIPDHEMSPAGRDYDKPEELKPTGKITPTITPAEFDRRMGSIDHRDSGRVEVPEPVRPLEADDADKERFDAAVERRDRMQAWAADRPDDLRAEEQVRRAEARVREAELPDVPERREPVARPVPNTDHRARAATHRQTAQELEAVARDAAAEGDREAARLNAVAARASREAANTHDEVATVKRLQERERAALAADQERRRQEAEAKIGDTAGRLDEARAKEEAAKKRLEDLRAGRTEPAPKPAGRRRNFQTIRKQAAEGMAAGAAAMQAPHDGSALPEQPMYASLSREQRADLDAQHRAAKTRQDARGVELLAQRLAAEAESNRRADAAVGANKPAAPENKYNASQLESGLWVTPHTLGTYSTRRDAETAARATLNDYAPRKQRQPKPEKPRAGELRDDINAAAQEQRASGKIGKQTSDMTQAEFLQKQGALYGGGDRAKAAHRRMVEGTISRGEYVPPEVLADYPDLAAKLTAGST